MIATAVTILMVALGQQYTPAEAQALFSEANDAFLKEAYAEAQDKYQRLLASGYGGPDVLYNLGTSYLAQRKLGPAVLHLERAARFGDDDDVEANLSYAASLSVDNVIGAESGATVFGERLTRALPLQLPSLLLLVGVFAAVALWLTRRLVMLHSTAWWISFAASAVVATVGLSLVLTQRHVLRAQTEVVVQAEKSQVADSWTGTGRVLFEVHAGLKVRVLERRDNALRIRLPNALEGWIQSSDVEQI
jgi:tetratricopeptide (TPR) repeat protein